MASVTKAMASLTKANVAEAVRNSPVTRVLRRSPVGDSLAHSTAWKWFNSERSGRSVRPNRVGVEEAKTSLEAPDRVGVQEAKNPLETYFYANQGRLIHKWVHYFEIYHRHFRPFRNKPVTIVEFGVSQGGSLQMWKHYFGPEARIIGVDINPKCAALAEPQIQIRIGDQEDRSFLRSLADEVGGIDVLIEDGGHTMGQQIATFEEMWPNIVEVEFFSLRTSTRAICQNTEVVSAEKVLSLNMRKNSSTRSTRGTLEKTLLRSTSTPRQFVACTSTTAL
jgi:cephalosporin hydroxylase